MKGKAGCLTAVSVLAAAGVASVCGAGTVSVALSNSTYAVRAEFEVNAPPELVWSVLTDYDGIDGFVSNIAASRVVEGENGVIVEQRGRYNLLIFFPVHADVTLRVEESPFSEIRFTDISGKDFETYEGLWRIEPAEESVLISYELKVDPKFINIGAVNRRVFRSLAASMMSDIRKEISGRRAKEIGDGNGPYEEKK